MNGDRGATPASRECGYLVAGVGGAGEVGRDEMDRDQRFADPVPKVGILEVVREAVFPEAAFRSFGNGVLGEGIEAQGCRFDSRLWLRDRKVAVSAEITQPGIWNPATLPSEVLL